MKHTEIISMYGTEEGVLRLCELLAESAKIELEAKKAKDEIREIAEQVHQKAVMLIREIFSNEAH